MNMNRPVLRGIENIIRAPQQHLVLSKRGLVSMFVTCSSMCIFSHDSCAEPAGLRIELVPKQ